MSISVRKANASDAGAIAELEKTAFLVPWSEDSIRRDIEENDTAHVVVAEDGGVFAGYADIWLVAGEGQLNNIAVMPEMRRRGVGTAIMEALIDFLGDSGAFEMSLEVREGNENAQRLYRRLGFTCAGVRPHYYEDNGEDALIMKRNI
jgi:ribosomal-protein-alanine N-acetyltransferase